MFIQECYVRISLEEKQIRLSFDELTSDMRRLVMSDVALILTVRTTLHLTKGRKYMPHETTNRIIL